MQTLETVPVPGALPDHIGELNLIASVAFAFAEFALLELAEAVGVLVAFGFELASAPQV